MHGAIKKFVVTLLVRRHFFIVRDARRACVDFCDPTAGSRIKNAIHHILRRRPVSRGNLVLEWNNREKEKVRSQSGIVRDEVER